MVIKWRLYDIIKGQWHNRERYESLGTCVAAADLDMRQARAEARVLELLAQPTEDEIPFGRSGLPEGADLFESKFPRATAAKKF